MKGTNPIARSAALVLFLFPACYAATAPHTAGCANVADYGAVGDGRATDTSAFQAALRTADCIVIPAGHFRIPAFTVRKRNLEIHGAGKDSTTLLVTVGPSGFWAQVTVGSLDFQGFTIEPAQRSAIGGRDSAFVLWMPDSIGVGGSIRHVAFSGCSRVCLIVRELLGTATIDSVTFGALPPFTASAQTYAIQVRNDARHTPPGRGMLRLEHSLLDNAHASGKCRAGPSAGGLFSYASPSASPLHLDVERNTFICLGAADRRSPVGAVELYAHVDSTRIIDNRFERSTYSAVKTAISRDLTVVGNTIIDSDSSVVAAAISVAGCIRGPEYCREAYGNWRVDSNTIQGLRGSAPAIRVGGGYAMARSAAPRVVAADCGTGQRVDANMVCIRANGTFATPYNADSVQVAWNVISRGAGADSATVAIDVSQAMRPVVEHNVITGTWRTPVIIHTVHDR